MMAAVAVAESLNKYGLEARIKWPNDVLIKGKKICGILTEMRSKDKKVDYVILGLGINVNIDVEELPENIRSSATSLKAELGEAVGIKELLQYLLGRLDHYYDVLRSGESGEIVESWRGLCDTIGRDVKIISQNETIEGVAFDIDNRGALLVKAKNGKTHKILAGDCMHLLNEI
jgi:BirA family biotin operon repressor/biotin-[acetyl-CoA-carboxylase] ligase